MLTVRHFTTSLTNSALRFLDQEITEWIRDEAVQVREIRECYGQTPTGMSGSMEHAIILSVWYEAPEGEQAEKAKAGKDASPSFGPGQNGGLPGTSGA